MKSNNSFIKKILQLFLIALLLVGIFFIGVNIFKSVQKYRSVNKEIVNLEQEAERFDQENKKLNRLINYFSSDDFQEKEIKEKLNLVKEGEKVVFVQGVKDDIAPKAENSDQRSEVNIKHANYYYWWQYFFGGESNN